MINIVIVYIAIPVHVVCAVAEAVENPVAQAVQSEAVAMLALHVALKLSAGQAVQELVPSP